MDGCNRFNGSTNATVNVMDCRITTQHNAIFVLMLILANRYFRGDIFLCVDKSHLDSTVYQILLVEHQKLLVDSVVVVTSKASQMLKLY